MRDKKKGKTKPYWLISGIIGGAIGILIILLDLLDSYLEKSNQYGQDY